MQKLNATAIKAIKFKGKPTKHFDGHGLYLHVEENSRTWRYSFRLGGKPRIFTIGKDVHFTLAEARKEHRAARKLVEQGTDPVAERKRRKADATAAEEANKRKATTVIELAEKWFRLESKKKDWKSTHANKVHSRFQHIPNSIKHKSVAEVTPDDIDTLLSNVTSRNLTDTAHRLKSYLLGIFDLAIILDIIESNPVASPKVQLPKRPKQTNYPHITNKHQFRELLIGIDKHRGSRNVEAAIRLTPLLFVRPSELRFMRWSEVDFELKQWKLPAARMKSSRDHIVPLSSQALAILEHLRDYSDGSDLVFASERNPNKPISDGTVGKALRSIGFGSDVITPHGFRHTASTFLNERTFTVNDESRKFEPDVIERQLAHVQSGVRGIYNKAEYIEDRTLMMQAWADWLDELKG